MINVLKSKKFYGVLAVVILAVSSVLFFGYCISNRGFLKDQTIKIEDYCLEKYSQKAFVKSVLRDSNFYNKNKMKSHILANFDMFLKSNSDLSTSISHYFNIYDEAFSTLLDLKKMKGIMAKDYAEINTLLNNFEFENILKKLKYITFKTSSNDTIARKKFLEGIVFELNFNPEMAKNLYVEATKLNEYEPKFYNHLGNVYYVLYDFNSAVDAFTRGLSISNFGTKKNRTQELILLSNLARTYYTLGNREKSFANYSNLLVNAINIDNLNYEWVAVYNLANIEADFGNYDTAIDYLNYALKLSTKMRNKNYIANSLDLLSKLQYRYGDYTNGKKNGLKAIKFAKKLSNFDLAADGYLRVCLNYEYLGEKDLAKLYCDRAIKINEVLGKILIRPKYYIRNGFIYDFVSIYRNYGKSMTNYTKAYAISQRFNLYLCEIQSLYGMSGAEISNGQYDESVKLLDKATKIENKLKIFKDSCYDCKLGSAYWGKDEIDKAIRHYKNAISTALSKGNNIALSELASHLAIIYYNRKDYDEALKYSTLALETNKKLYRFDHHYIDYQKRWQEDILSNLSNKKGK